MQQGAGRDSQRRGEADGRVCCAVHYRDYWFWIDQGDLRTKRALVAVIFFFTLADTGGNEALPLITSRHNR
jgi:hypothetical protein